MMANSETKTHYDCVIMLSYVRCTASEPFYSVKISVARATHLRRLIVGKLMLKMRAGTGSVRVSGFALKHGTPECRTAGTLEY